MRVFFNYLYSEHEIKKNPMEKVKLLKDDRKPLEFISDENFMRLLRCLDRSKFSENRDWTIIQLLIDTGMRIGECLLIKISEVDLTRKSISKHQRRQNPQRIF
jgi:integrase/recombinase XerD